VRLLVTLRKAPAEPSIPIVIQVDDLAGNHSAEARDFFRAPERNGSGKR
jgi:hypothetical protein